MDESDEFQDRLKTVVYKHWKGNAALIYGAGAAAR